MSLPSFRDDGWLPDGHFHADWDEIITAFGGEADSQRSAVMANLIEWRDAAWAKGLSGTLILDGSFISRKEKPGDFDLIFVYDEHTRFIIETDPEARLLVNYTYCNDKGWGDVFIFADSAVRQFPEFCDLTMFDRDKRTKLPKGVVEVIL